MKPMFARTILWLFSRICYRVTVLSTDNVPATGGALLVSNHISFVDMVLILASTRRFVRFLLPENICALWYLRPFLRLLQVIPLPPESQPRVVSRAIESVRDAIRSRARSLAFSPRRTPRASA